MLFFFAAAHFSWQHESCELSKNWRCFGFVEPTTYINKSQVLRIIERFVFACDELKTLFFCAAIYLFEDYFILVG